MAGIAPIYRQHTVPKPENILASALKLYQVSGAIYESERRKKPYASFRMVTATACFQFCNATIPEVMSAINCSHHSAEKYINAGMEAWRKNEEIDGVPFRTLIFLIYINAPDEMIYTKSDFKVGQRFVNPYDSGQVLEITKMMGDRCSARSVRGPDERWEIRFDEIRQLTSYSISPKTKQKSNFKAWQRERK